MEAALNVSGEMAMCVEREHADWGMQVAQPADLGGVHMLRFGDLFVDENTGWVHVCDSSCALQTADEDGELFKCPLTGRLHSRIAAGGPCSDAAPAALAASGEVQDAMDTLPTGLGVAPIELLHSVHEHENLLLQLAAEVEHIRLAFPLIAPSMFFCMCPSVAQAWITSWECLLAVSQACSI